MSLYRSGCSFISAPTPANINDSRDSRQLNPSQVTVRLLFAVPQFSGMRFPFEYRFGNCIPFWANILGCSFRSTPHSESMSQYLAENWDALSG